MTTLDNADLGVVRLDQPSVADVLVEAVAYSSTQEDPFHAANFVATYLWNHGIVITRAQSSIKLTILRGITWAGLGAGISRAIRAATEGDPIWPFAIGWVVLVSIAIGLLYTRWRSSQVQPFD